MFAFYFFRTPFKSLYYFDFINNAGDLKGIGETMNTCWEHKKLMAPGCEPEICRKMIDAIDPLAYGNTS